MWTWREHSKRRGQPRSGWWIQCTHFSCNPSCSTSCSAGGFVYLSGFRDFPDLFGHSCFVLLFCPFSSFSLFLPKLRGHRRCCQQVNLLLRRTPQPTTIASLDEIVRGQRVSAHQGAFSASDCTERQVSVEICLRLSATLNRVQGLHCRHCDSLPLKTSA